MNFPHLCNAVFFAKKCTSSWFHYKHNSNAATLSYYIFVHLPTHYVWLYVKCFLTFRGLSKSQNNSRTLMSFVLYLFNFFFLHINAVQIFITHNHVIVWCDVTSNLRICNYHESNKVIVCHNFWRDAKWGHLIPNWINKPFHIKYWNEYKYWMQV